ncbi:MAG: hypothetical protein J6R59_09645 [Paludibacteraceae bacterium]|nr:hypothetical protein [Paludibacteraceae bacterium]
MAESNNATCSICGNGYHLCLSCKDKMELHPWKIHCCSADCFKVFQVVRGFSTKVYTKDEFRSKLKNIDLSNLENYREHIKALIKDALKEDSVKNIETVEEVVENIKTEENVITEDVKVSEVIAPRKRNYKVNKIEEAE